jgi:hypothetical protein
MHTGGPGGPPVLPGHFCNLSDRRRTGKAAGRIARKCHRHEEFAAASVNRLAVRRHFRQTFWRMLSQLIT